MSHYLDELAMVAENREPIPFEEAVRQGTYGKRFVFIHPTIQSSHESFIRLRSLLPPHMVKKIRDMYIILKNDAELIFLTPYQIEHNALRGLGKVIWVC